MGTGYVYEFKISGKALKVNDEEETMKEVMDRVDEAEQGWRDYGDPLHVSVTKYLGKWADEWEGCNIVWMADPHPSVFTPFEQILVTDKSVIKSVKLHKGK